MEPQTLWQRLTDDPESEVEPSLLQLLLYNLTLAHHLRQVGDDPLVYEQARAWYFHVLDELGEAQQAAAILAGVEPVMASVDAAAVTLAPGVCRQQMLWIAEDLARLDLS